MINFEVVQNTALKLPEAIEATHFEKTAFEVAKKIFATFDAGQRILCVKLSITNQDVFCLSNTGAIYQVPNKWGQQGWALVNLQAVCAEMLIAIIRTAYCDVAPKKLIRSVNFD